MLQTRTRQFAVVEDALHAHEGVGRLVLAGGRRTSMGRFTSRAAHAVPSADRTGQARKATSAALFGQNKKRFRVASKAVRLLTHMVNA